MYLGIDFSGGSAPWKKRCSRPTVWIATLNDANKPHLIDVRPVQQLPGEGEPFHRLIALLRTGEYTAAAIDAPFSIPAENLPTGGHSALLSCVSGLPPAPDRPFPSGAALVELAQSFSPLGERKKPYRETERRWTARGVNTRSTLWNGPRGGAPFAAACLSLLTQAGRPIWPWKSGPGMLVEAFPAAQLRAWGLPHGGYSKPEQRNVREQIVDGLKNRLEFSTEQRLTFLDVPDALDAVIAAFAAIAASQGGPPAAFPADGLIAVLDDRNVPVHAEKNLEEPELFEELLSHPDVRIERIISRGHVTPPDEPYVQNWDEWVMVLSGTATLSLVGVGRRTLQSGEHLLIPAGVAHFVTHTDDPTIWLAIHIGNSKHVSS
ncbi:DUF429 domain-containing protein [Sphingobium sp. EP60837]|uniref:DUF429 domain-containing protein n=1 Tax=Sphingobium sp. EP60837 TaxID=1855519 RepID=UPI0007DDD3F1|nr:DUF429 domain-containing protein [Sphingobium sp. EP60837]ANI79266.1 hypothetical protein EP837_02872 [Sphingobium sp. EP60837]